MKKKKLNRLVKLDDLICLYNYKLGGIMDNILMEKTLIDLDKLQQNTYPINSPMDNLELVKTSLKELNLQFKIKNVKNKEYIQIYHKDKLLSKYSKANYPNNKFLGQSICNDKYKTEYYLNINNVPTPKSQVFEENSFEKALDFIKDIPAPFVIKALDLRQGIGVYTDVYHKDFSYYWNKLIELQRKRRNTSPKVLIQNQLDGLEVRINVTEGVVESAILRLQGFLIGDGVHTIDDLIRMKNEEKKKNPYLNRDMILFDEELMQSIYEAGKDRTSILNNNEMLLLNKKPEIRYGMETYNVTAIVDERILEIGLNAVLAIPGLHTAGVDIIIPELTSEIGHVIEVNKNPAWALSLYAVRGPAGEPVKDVFRSHLIDNKIMDNEIKSKDDFSEEEMKIMLERYKFLYKKDQYNRKIISHYHKQ